MIFQSTLTTDVAACAGAAKPVNVATDVAIAARAAVVARCVLTFRISPHRVFEPERAPLVVVWFWAITRANRQSLGKN